MRCNVFHIYRHTHTQTHADEHISYAYMESAVLPAQFIGIYEILGMPSLYLYMPVKLYTKAYQCQSNQYYEYLKHHAEYIVRISLHWTG